MALTVFLVFHAHAETSNPITSTQGTIALIAQAPPTPRKPTAYNACSCVLYARAVTGFSESVGRAINWPINASWPVIGGVVVERINMPVGHVSVIIGLIPEGIVVREGNYKPCQITTRVIPYGSPTIIGYWQP